MVLAFWLMLIVVVPVIGMAIGFAWRYRATANRDHAPDWDRSRGIEIVVWGGLQFWWRCSGLWSGPIPTSWTHTARWTEMPCQPKCRR